MKRKAALKRRLQLGSCSVEKAAALLLIYEQVEDRNGARPWRPPSGGLDPGHCASKHKEFHKEHNVAVRGSICLLCMLCGCRCITQHASAVLQSRRILPAISASVTSVHQAMQYTTSSAIKFPHCFQPSQPLHK